MCTQIRFPYSCRGENKIKDGTPRRPSLRLRLKNGDVYAVSGCPETAVKGGGRTVGWDDWDGGVTIWLAEWWTMEFRQQIPLVTLRQHLRRCFRSRQNKAHHHDGFRRFLLQVDDAERARKWQKGMKVSQCWASKNQKIINPCWVELIKAKKKKKKQLKGAEELQKSKFDP